MVEKLTLSKLKEYGFDFESGRAQMIVRASIGQSILHCNKGHFVADAENKLIYSGIDALRIVYFRNLENVSFPKYDLNLIPEFFHYKLTAHLKKVKAKAGIIYNETESTKLFIESEINQNEERLNKIRHKAAPAYLKAESESLEAYSHYIVWLKNKLKPTYKTYNSFEDLFNDAIIYGSIESPINAAHHSASLSYYNTSFNTWLSEVNGSLWDNHIQYRELLTKENWSKFIEYEKQSKSEAKDKYEKEAETWKKVSDITKVETFTETLSGINEYFENLRTAFNNDKDFRRALALIEDYFLGVEIKISEPIFVKNGNIKTLAFALGEVWRSKSNDVITYQYLEFYKQVFSIFRNQDIDRGKLFGCNLYKYSISKT